VNCTALMLYFELDAESLVIWKEQLHTEYLCTLQAVLSFDDLSLRSRQIFFTVIESCQTNGQNSSKCLYRIELTWLNGQNQLPRIYLESLLKIELHMKEMGPK